MDYEPSLDTSGGAWGDVFSGGSAWDNQGSADSPFWDWSSDAWSPDYDNMFATQSNWGFDTTEDFSVGDAFVDDLYSGDLDDPWWKKITDSPSLMKTIGGLGLGAANLLSKKSDAKDAKGEAERQRRWEEKMARLKMEHDQKMLEMKLGAGGGGGGYSGPERPAPGKADSTTTAIDSQKVDWSKKK